MKYNVYLEDVSVEAVFNKLGGVGGAKRFLADELLLVEAPKPEPPPAPTEFSLSLDACARLPFAGAVLEVHRGSGVVKVERKLDGIYVGGKRPGSFLSEGQKGGKVIQGHKLRKEVEARGKNLSAVLLDFFVEHPTLWPEEWKKDSQGNTLYVFFWDDVFRNPSRDNLYVRYGYWKKGRVVSNYNWLDNDWNGNNPAASATLFISPSSL